MKDDDVLIRVENVSKRFCRDLKRSLFYGVQDVASEMLGIDRSGKGLRKAEFWANTGISFELRRGECLGLIGHNGAGKTTLLKMLNGLIKPDTGSITMRGQVGALIALGAGFNPILTGRENVFIAGSVLGLKKREIAAKYDEIVEFAELEGFMDSPVQNYSSGMQVRLGFAVATAMNPDVLLVDEVLAVGDAAFRNKCYERVASLLEDSAVILVTHNMAHIGRICNRALVLDHGRTAYLGETSEGIAIYDGLSNQRVAAIEGAPMFNAPARSATVEFSDERLDYGQKLGLRIELELDRPEHDCFAYVYFFDASNNIVAQWQTRGPARKFDLEAGRNELAFEIGPVHLRKGAYRLSVIVKDANGLRNLVWTDRRDRIEVDAGFYGEGPYQVPSFA